MAPRPNPDELQRQRAQLLDEVMRSSRRHLWRQARRFSTSDQDADDAIEDACIAFLRSFRTGPDSHPVGWMMTTVKHAALKIRRHADAQRKRDAAPVTDADADDWWHDEVADLAASVEEQVEDRLWVMVGCGELLAELKPDERTALSLIAFGLSYREIGERQGWTATKLNRCAAEGRAHLRELLARRGERP